MEFTRRDLLKAASSAASAPGGAAFLAAWFSTPGQAAGQSQTATHNMASHSTAPPQSALLRDYKPNFFDAEDFAALQSFTEILIPSDDGSPGAREAYCAHFIDFVLNSADLVPRMREQWREALAALKQAGFHSADAQGRLAIMRQISGPERDAEATHPAFTAYKLIKQQNTFAFYSSRVGMIETLDYKGNSYNAAFPPCNHPEHQSV